MPRLPTAGVDDGVRARPWEAGRCPVRRRRGVLCRGGPRTVTHLIPSPPLLLRGTAARLPLSASRKGASLACVWDDSARCVSQGVAPPRSALSEPKLRSPYLGAPTTGRLAGLWGQHRGADAPAEARGHVCFLSLQSQSRGQLSGDLELTMEVGPCVRSSGDTGSEHILGLWRANR